MYVPKVRQDAAREAVARLQSPRPAAVSSLQQLPPPSPHEPARSRGLGKPSKPALPLEVAPAHTRVDGPPLRKPLDTIDANRARDGVVVSRALHSPADGSRKRPRDESSRQRDATSPVPLPEERVPSASLAGFLTPASPMSTWRSQSKHTYGKPRATEGITAMPAPTPREASPLTAVLTPPRHSAGAAAEGADERRRAVVGMDGAALQPSSYSYSRPHALTKTYASSTSTTGMLRIVNPNGSSLRSLWGGAGLGVWRSGGGASPSPSPYALEGFKNIGNTCYLNAVLSCLVHLPLFCDALTSPCVLAEVDAACDRVETAKLLQATAAVERLHTPPRAAGVGVSAPGATPGDRVGGGGGSADGGGAVERPSTPATQDVLSQGLSAEAAIVVDDDSPATAAKGGSRSAYAAAGNCSGADSGSRSVVVVVVVGSGAGADGGDDDGAGAGVCAGGSSGGGAAAGAGGGGDDLAKDMPLEVFRSLRDVIHTKRTTRSEVVNPRSVKDAVAKSAAMFVGNEQQDAHEFFSSCMAQLTEELLPCTREVVKHRYVRSATEPPTWIERAALMWTPSFQCFNLEVRGALTCTKCGHSRNVTEMFTSLSLDLEARPEMEFDAVHLREHLRQYFKLRTLEYRCEECKHNEVRVATALTAVPKVLVLHLKRFVPNVATQRYEKCRDRVSVPTELDVVGWCAETLRLPPPPSVVWVCGGCTTRNTSDEAACSECGSPRSRADESDEVLFGRDQHRPPSVKYHLQAVLRHEGSSAFFGHYVADVCDRPPAAGMPAVWKRHNDSVVRRVSQEEVLGRNGQEAAYMLFYVLDKDLLC